MTPPDEAVTEVRARRTLIGPFTARQIGPVNAIFRGRRACHPGGLRSNRDVGLVAVDVQGVRPDRPALRRAGWPEIYLRRNHEDVRRLGLPTHYFIDRQGLIRDRYFGPLKGDQMEQRIALISQP